MLLKRLMLTLSVLLVMAVNSHAQETVAVEVSTSEQENASLEETITEQDSDDSKDSDDSSIQNATVVNNDPSVAKTLSGISIIGNEDAPKSLYIVPWRGSELELETDLNSSLLNEGFHAVDKDVFIRELEFYESTTVK